MGLDMYLTAERYYWGFDEESQPPEVAGVPEGFKVGSVRVQAAYWRKANMIHQWFVTNVQGGEDECKPHDVDREMLQALIDRCKRVIADPTLAAAELPVQSGFFFGSVEYDEWYFDDLKETVEMLEKALAAFGDSWSFEYKSSW